MSPKDLSVLLINSLTSFILEFSSSVSELVSETEILIKLTYFGEHC